jgi:bifunctional pyridoxal-dependent enzyme with beta-cystathionase and maltose regulon repressor activities
MRTSRFDFDTVIDRRPFASVKWDRYRGTDIIPLWVADMDFRSPPAVMAALHERIDHGVFGYTDVPPELVTAVLDSLAGEYGWEVQPEWLVWLPGLVTGLNVACREGEAWRRELIACLRANRDLVDREIAGMPGLAATPVEATYLTWIDARGLGGEQPEKFFEAAGVGLSDGADFGAPGYLRLNFGCPRTLLAEALERMKAALARR